MAKCNVQLLQEAPSSHLPQISFRIEILSQREPTEEKVQFQLYVCLKLYEFLLLYLIIKNRILELTLPVQTIDFYE